MLALAVKGLSSGYGDAMILRDVDLVVHAGEIFSLLGKNGMGKSTLLKSIMGFLPIRTGKVELFGHEVTGLPPHRVARKAISYTPQERALFQDLTVEDNLRLGLRDNGTFDAGLERVGRLFPFLPGRTKQRAGTLSGGEQKMLLVARSLMARPKLMLVDEISEGLQPSVIDRLAQVLRSERDAGTSILLVEQNVRFAMSVADRYAVLKLGEIADQGSVGAPEIEEKLRIS